MDTPVDHLIDTSLPDRTAVILGLKHAADRQRQAEIDQVCLVAVACDVYSWVDPPPPNARDDLPSVLHGERLIRLGGDGTPQVAEFCTLEIGPALGISPSAAAELVADVVDLRHRLPRLWALVLAGHVRVWAARRVAGITRTKRLSPAQCAEVDRHLAPFAPQYSPRRLFDTTDALCDTVDPAGAEARRAAELQARHVDIRTGPAGTALVRGQLDGAAGLRLDHTLTRLAGILAAADTHPDPQGGEPALLRAQALELLADPVRAAWALGQTPLPAATVQPTSEATPTGTSTADVAVAPAPARETLELVVHVRPDDIARGAGGLMTTLGPVARSQLDQLIADAARVTIRPVIDHDQPRVTVGREPTPTQRREVLLREQVEAFPHSTRPSASRWVDLDHIIPWPHGRTSTANLAPLGRLAHRAKTHGGFNCTPVRPGVTLWRTPAGMEYWTTPHGTYDRDPDTDLVIDPIGTRRRIRHATRAAARLAREHQRQQAEHAAARLLDHHAPALIPLTEHRAA